MAAQGWAAFADGDEATALARFRKAVRLGDPDPETLAACCDLLAGEAAVADELAALLEEAWGDWPPALHARVAARRFDALLATPGTVAPETLAAAALETLEAAAGGGRGADAWAPLADPDRRAALLDALAGAGPEALIAALEHLSFAPPLRGLHDRALSWAAQTADANPHLQAVMRAAERALYDLGDAESARRIERARKATRPRAAPAASPPATPISLAGLVVAVAGGHDGLRALVASDLLLSGARDVRGIPPAWEGQLGGGVEPVLRGADLAVLVVRQLDHSTGDSVIGAASALGVPVRRARSASRAAVRAEVEWFARGRG